MPSVLFLSITIIYSYWRRKQLGRSKFPWTYCSHRAIPRVKRVSITIELERQSSKSSGLNRETYEHTNRPNIVLWSMSLLAKQFLNPRRRAVSYVRDIQCSNQGLDQGVTYSGSGAWLKTVGPPTISLVHTSLKNQPTWPTAQPAKSAMAALHDPFMIHEKATSATGR